MTRRHLLAALAPLLASGAIGGAPQAASASSRFARHRAGDAAPARQSSYHSELAPPSPGPRPPRSCLRTVSQRAGRSAGARVGVCHARVGSRHRGPRKSPAPSRLTGQPSAATLRAATIAKVLAMQCENTQLSPEAGNLALVREAVLCLINRERAQNGALPLILNPALQAAAESHAAEMVAGDYFEHVSPGGLTPVGRVRADGYLPNPDAGYIVGENIAWGTLSLATPQAIVAAWIASPEHLANIQESQYLQTGIGVAPLAPALLSGGQPGATYAQEFGVVIP